MDTMKKLKTLWQQIPSTIITEMFCSSSFDGVVFDTEHGCYSNETLYSCIQISSALRKKSFVRVTDLNKTLIRMVLDAGVSGLIMSTVETIGQAKEFKDFCTYPKNGGSRGQGLVRENMWGDNDFEFRTPILISQIETKKGVDNIEEISSLGFDFYLVGPYDLSASLGDVGNFKSKEYLFHVRPFLPTE